VASCTTSLHHKVEQKTIDKKLIKNKETPDKKK
jgi:hypothetical protein